ncbi:MAG TPA: AtzH-like domain-containing protein [Terracidiphilus sp.]|nr:AtzH-like domain-containing protein [Terracidiphilus sp.]
MPAPCAPGGNYAAAERVGAVLYLSGVISTRPEGVIAGMAGGRRQTWRGRVTRLDVASFGRDFRSITLEFERARPDGGVTRGRQSQVWARMPEGWRIVQAKFACCRSHTRRGQAEETAILQASFMNESLLLTDTAAPQKR